jgi:hypothetical protein
MTNDGTMTNDGSACAVGPDKVVYRTAVRSIDAARDVT